jgi:AraC family transcriptional regulator of adaptative response / methylphosphotriester-DNA alkyltransferase methyltransferase
MLLSDEEKWQAVNQNNAAFDGRFYYGVRTTGIFCRPSCKSKPPLADNTLFFDNAETACRHGFRPCKRCRPDLLEYQPALELLEQAKSLYNNHFNDKDRLAAELKSLPVSHVHLIRLFRTNYGVTPNEYLNRLRVAKAAESLLQSDASMLDIAYSTGFGSLSGFYFWFKKITGAPPLEYRRRKFHQ